MLNNLITLINDYVFVEKIRDHSPTWEFGKTVDGKFKNTKYMEFWEKAAKHPEFHPLIERFGEQVVALNKEGDPLTCDDQYVGNEAICQLCVADKKYIPLYIKYLGSFDLGNEGSGQSEGIYAIEEKWGWCAETLPLFIERYFNLSGQDGERSVTDMLNNGGREALAKNSELRAQLIKLAEENEKDGVAAPPYDSEDFVEFLGIAFPGKAEELLPKELREKLKTIKESIAEAEAKREKEKIESRARGQAAHEQLAIAAGIGSVGTLIKHECDYALYLAKEERKDGFDGVIYVTLCAFYPATQKVVRFEPRKEYVTKSYITKEAAQGGNPWYADGHDGYVILSNGKQVESMKSGDRIQMLVSSRMGGWDNKGNLVIAGKYNLQLPVYTYRYIGYIKDKKAFFEADCGLAD